jgi:hypothetical protein
MNSKPPGVISPLSPKWKTHPKTQLEFLLALVETAPDVKIAPINQPKLATRDPSTIESWELQGIETVALGIGLRS